MVHDSLALSDQILESLSHLFYKNDFSLEISVEVNPPEKVCQKVRKLNAKIWEKVRDACLPFELTDDDLRNIMQLMDKSFDEGLSPETASTAAVKMLPSYVRAVPNGTEQGHFLALDLGGTNFRVLLIRLEGNQSEMTSKIFRVPDHIMKGTGEALFDHIAGCLARFMEEHNLKDAVKLPLGFTFSFPCKQEGLTHAKLVNWTKGFKASGVEGNDVVGMLRDACHRRGSFAVPDPMPVIWSELIGSKKLNGEIDPEKDGLPAEMCVNTEWGGFGDDGVLDFMRTKYDRALDEKTINVGKQLYEKMISGMYLGELVRVVLHSLAMEGLLFDGDVDAIELRGCFPTKFVSEIEAEMQEDKESPFTKTQQILEEIGIPMVSAIDCANVAYICQLVSTRAAYICAAGIAALLKRMQKPMVTVGVDGSVYRFHPTFPSLLDKKIRDLLQGENLKFQLMLSEDGSGRGAALVAAVATRMAKERLEKQNSVDMI
ncbi:hypothetical protein M3Y98_00493700 [Aphelenchoides besseyi]|nr:hypothetical protein M3Y98_00493700 [Aphelenchoides besseyi]